MRNRTTPTLFVLALAALALAAPARPVKALQQQPAAAAAAVVSDREQDGLAGPVRRVKTETAKVTAKNAKPFEGPRVLLETATYDIKGAKLDNAYFLAAAGGTLTGKESYKYDDRGNIVEMTLKGDDGSLLSKEVYTYEFDAFGNWTKMITSVAVMEGGRLSFEPTEVTYRTISYFLDEATMAKMSQPAAAPAQPAPAPVASTPAASTPAASAPSSNVSDNKSVASSADNKAVAASAPMNASAPKSNTAASSAAAKSEVKTEVKNAKADTVKMPAAPSAASLDRPTVAATTTVAGAGTGASSAAPVVKSDGEAPPERAVARGSLKPISGGILNGKAVSLPAPLYPEVAKRARMGGQVTVDVIIDLNGKVISVKAVSGPAVLQAAAEQAARQARFSPTLLSGQPVRVSGQINYNFTLK